MGQHPSYPFGWPRGVNATNLGHPERIGAVLLGRDVFSTHHANPLTHTNDCNLFIIRQPNRPATLLVLFAKPWPFAQAHPCLRTSPQTVKTSVAANRST